ncbi:MAG: hypothetical protein WCS37_09330 [Chloroflexota bacterium]|nr:hypothetical protein [Chloroflexota bacterium]
MALKVTVSSGKQDTSRPAGLVRRGEPELTDKHGQVSISELVESVFSQVRASIEKEADVEVEITANVEIVSKEGVNTINLDVSGESPNARTLRLKFSTKINPKEEAKG